jgi:hypothetical protein
MQPGEYSSPGKGAGSGVGVGSLQLMLGGPCKERNGQPPIVPDGNYSLRF